MSILIKGIDMPKEGEYIPMRIYGNGHIWVNGAYKGVAIQIPTPHGRLIDWDAFNSKLEIQYAEGRGKALAPTILEAEE